MGAGGELRLLFIQPPEQLRALRLPAEPVNQLPAFLQAAYVAQDLNFLTEDVLLIGDRSCVGPFEIAHAGI